MRGLAILAVVTVFLIVAAADAKVTEKKPPTVDHCALLDDFFKESRKLDKIKMQHLGTQMRINVMSTYRGPSRAIAALLAAGIRSVAGYDDVYTLTDNRTMKELADTIPKYSTESFEDDIIHIHVDADWEEPELGAPLLPNCNRDMYSCSIAGPRLLAIGRSPSTALHVYSVLSENSEKVPECAGANTWSFYQDKNVLNQCGFTSPSNDCLQIYTMVQDLKELTNIGKFYNEFEAFKNKTSICLSTKNLNRLELNDMLNDVKRSFVFIDYELDYEKNYTRVQVVQLPPLPLNNIPFFAMRVADHFILIRHAPYIVQVLRLMRPQPEDLRQILNIEADLKNIDNAACSWARDNQLKFKQWTNKTIIIPKFVVIVCNNSDLNEYRKLELNNSILEDIQLFHFKVLFLSHDNCGDENSISVILNNMNDRSEWPEIAGVAVPRSVIPKNSYLQIVFYDVPSPKTILQDGVSTSFGSLQQLTKSILYFFKKQDWNRVAIISEKSATADNITSQLTPELNCKQEILTEFNKENITKALQNFKNANARVFFINAEPVVASLIICEAVKLGMVTEKGEYVWIAREWRPSSECNDQDSIEVLTVSYWWRGGDDTHIKHFGGDAKIREFIKPKLQRNASWPILAEPLINALLLMIYRTHRVVKDHPERLFDLHTPETIKLMEAQSHSNNTIRGVIHNINQKDHMQRNPYVYVNAWRGNVNKLVAIWRIQNDTDQIQEINNNIYDPYNKGNKPHDGRSKCITTTSGDKFDPLCHDPIWFCALAVLIIIPVAVWKTRQMIQNKFRRQERETLMRLLSRCEKTASVLGPYLVDRASLELHEELGSGHFGRVRFCMLRARNLIKPTAAKTLRENAAPAEEAEFLREASTLATLSHEHIVGLVGVCADADGPPLLLMEHAFFGDLLKYLRQRRHLVEINERSSRSSDISVEEQTLKESIEAEACHVSPKELTRLAREAAGAVDYLSNNHLLHRDIRAANCLIDARRVLKLADFGMARCIEAKTRSPLDPNQNESQDYKYICCRRGVFPVPWMAPESLARGEFSRASDVWALGVLMLEITTLGARPYGSWKPMQVLHFVSSGGRPPIPRDASYHTVEVTEMCWTEQPSKRATAKEVVDYLTDRPTALRGALKPTWPELTEVADGSDSGFGDRTPENEWPKGDNLLVSTL